VSGDSGGTIAVWTIPQVSNTETNSGSWSRSRSRNDSTLNASASDSTGAVEATPSLFIVTHSFETISCFTELDHNMLAASYSNSTIRIWDLSIAEGSYCCVRYLQERIEHQVRFLGAMGDGRTLVTAAGNMRKSESIQMWDISSDDRIDPLVKTVPHEPDTTGSVGLSVLSDGVTIVHASADGVISFLTTHI
jgi:WD40 repeat protein